MTSPNTPPTQGLTPPTSDGDHYGLIQELMNALESENENAFIETLSKCSLGLLKLAAKILEKFYPGHPFIGKLNARIKALEAKIASDNAAPIELKLNRGMIEKLSALEAKHSSDSPIKPAKPS